ncbi:MAG: threonine/serine exporter family protein [Paludibacteraceae bacterium]
MALLFNVFSEIWEEVALSMIVSLGFAILFNTPKRALWIVALLGGIGFMIKLVLMHTVMQGVDVVAASLGAFAIGFLAVYFSHVAHTPPIVFTIPAVINMIPGKYGYQFMISLMKIVTTPGDAMLQNEVITETINKLLKTGFITLGLAFGIIAPMLLLNTYSVKDKDLTKILTRRLKKTFQIK